MTSSLTVTPAGFADLLDSYRPGNKLAEGLTPTQRSRIKSQARFFGCSGVQIELKHIYMLREEVRDLKPVGGEDLARAYRRLGTALIEHGHDPAYALRKLARAQALDPDAAEDVDFFKAWCRKVPDAAAAQRQLGHAYRVRADTTWDYTLAIDACAAAARLTQTADDHRGHGEAILRLFQDAINPMSGSIPAAAFLAHERRGITFSHANHPATLAQAGLAFRAALPRYGTDAAPAPRGLPVWHRRGRVRPGQL